MLKSPLCTKVVEGPKAEADTPDWEVEGLCAGLVLGGHGTRSLPPPAKFTERPEPGQSHIPSRV